MPAPSRLIFGLLPLVLLAAGPAPAETVCAIDLTAVEARIADLERDYAAVAPGVSCAAPALPAHRLICDEPTLARMARLDDMAWVMAVENATGTRVDQSAPPPDDSFAAARDACTGAACLCAVLIGHTQDSLGGTAPYP